MTALNDVIDTFWIDGSSSVLIEQIESFFDLKHFFFSKARSFERFGIELFRFRSFFHLNNSLN